jgi:hypothetical protein
MSNLLQTITTTLHLLSHLKYLQYLRYLQYLKYIVLLHQLSSNRKSLKLLLEKSPSQRTAQRKGMNSVQKLGKVIAFLKMLQSYGLLKIIQGSNLQYLITSKILNKTTLQSLMNSKLPNNQNLLQVMRFGVLKVDLRSSLMRMVRSRVIKKSEMR